ncbi:hypothetical protein EVAR_39176_1 [Eumeta japonica]|uniref:Uncharacterized protein n=1 Tax=Eumeta variegata TaxID=151549 RepID=A0A4C1VLH6_EUMVA|nr:hypothetical protein EVAR_39176_1 [Eumeta japonica]
MLLSIFENSKDAPTIAYIASIFRETLCLKQGKSKKCSANNLNRQQCVQVFVTLNGTQAVVRAVLANNSRREGVAGGEQLLSDLVWILASLATKDPKFATKVRMLGCVRILHYILKGHMTDNKFIFPLLIVIKQLTKNPITVSILIRDGIAVTYERALATLGCIPTVRLRLCLAGIAYMSKNSTQFI